MMMMMFLVGRGLVGCRMTCALGYLSLLLSSELCHYEDTSLSILVARAEVGKSLLLHCYLLHVPPTSASASLPPERHVLYSNG